MLEVIANATERLDFVLGLLLLLDFLGRMLSYRRPVRYLESFAAITDILVILSLFTSFLVENLVFLRTLRLLRAYKILLSPMFAGSCRFLPSCSDYAAEAVRRFGVVRGSLLAARRLARCHPLGAHGLDPVPQRGGSESH